MMKCSFQSIQGQGFMTFKDPFVFPIAVFGNQTVFIQGENRDEPMAESNGSGKSNLLEAFTFALFGKVSKKLRYLDDIINLESDVATVKVSFNLDGELYIVERGRNRHKTSNELHIYKGNGEEPKPILEDSDNTEKQAYIERLIGLNFLSYSHTIMFCQRFIAFPELKAPERAKVLSGISGATQYLKAAELAKERATGLSVAISNLEHNKANIQKVIDSLLVNDFAQAGEDWEEGQKQSLSEFKSDLIEQTKALKDSRTTHEKALKAQQFLIFTMEDKYKTAKDSLLPLVELTDLKTKQNNEVVKTDTQCKSLRSRITDKQRELKRLEDTKAGNCPYCGQEITKESLDEHIIELKIDLNYMEREHSTLKSILEDEKAQLAIYEEKIEVLNKLKRDMREFERKILVEKTKLESLENRKDEQAILEKIDYIEKQIQMLSKQVNPFIEMEKQQRTNLEKEVIKMEEVDKELLQLSDDKQYFVTWQENFPKLRMMLLDDIVSRLEVEAQEWLSNYSSELSIEIDTERQTASGNVRDEVHITIVTPKGKVPYEGYGGGETQKIRMSISLALSDIIAEKAERSYNLVMFDEPNVGLDRAGKEANLTVFEDVAKDKTVLIIEHDEYFTDRMNETVTVVKENHKSLIQGV